jgi:hypothetical protein
MNKDTIDNLFEQMPLEAPSGNFNAHIMELIQKENALKAKKAFIWRVVAIVASSISMLLGMYLYLVPILADPFRKMGDSFVRIINQFASGDYSLYLMIFGIALFLLIVEDCIRIYFKRKEI